MTLDLWLWSALVLGALGTLAWLALHGAGALALLRAARLGAGVAAEPGDVAWPSVSVIVPVRNEASELAGTIRSLLDGDYPGAVELVIVDDRSTDGSGHVGAAIAAEHPSARTMQVRTVSVHTLPAGWLGKVHALRRGVSAARGEYLLFTDVGVRFAPAALAAALRHAREQALDHLTLLPRFTANGFMHAALMQAFFVGYVRRTLSESDPGRGRAPFGFGAFNLVRREALEASEGLEWLRMDVLDDLAVGALMRRSGARSGVAVADRLLENHWYPDLASTLRGFEKNAFGGLAGYSVTRLVPLVIVLLLMPIAPLLPIVASAPAGWTLTALALAALASEAAVVRLRFGLPLAPALAAPLTHALMAYALVRGAVTCLRHDGVVWSGTHYPLDELRRGRRVSFP